MMTDAVAAYQTPQAFFKKGKTADLDLDTEVPTDSDDRSSVSDAGLPSRGLGSLGSFGSSSVASLSSTPDCTSRTKSVSPRTPESHSSGGFPEEVSTLNDKHSGPRWLSTDSNGRVKVVHRPTRTKTSIAPSRPQNDLMAAPPPPPPGLSLDSNLLSPPPGLHVPAKVMAPQPKPPREAVVSSDVSTFPETAHNTLSWVVDARKLNCDHKVIVSPSFEVEILGRCVPFKVILTPKEVSNRKGGQSFKRSRGVGNIQLKCESLEEFTEVVSVKFSVGRSLARGPVVHNFSQTGVCSLKSDQENWDFTKAVDRVSQQFDIRVQILPNKV